MFGYAGKILRVDLSAEKARTEPLNETAARSYIGGLGLGARILYDEVEASADALSPSNELIVALGPVNGTGVPASSRFAVVFKSPLTGIFGHSYCGGYFAPELKYAGYDAIVVERAAKAPVYLSIIDDDVKIMDAGKVWGKDTFETEDIIRSDLGEPDAQVLCIGPAGENLVRFASLNHSRGRQVGRCGAGAVMGSKKLKAIAVRGSGGVDVPDIEKLERAGEEWRIYMTSKLTSLIRYGTPAMTGVSNSHGALPTRYWETGTFEGAEKIGGERMRGSIVRRDRACFGCPVRCGKLSYLGAGPFADTVVEGPEYETLYAFGSLCANDDLASIAKANELCDRLGIDTMTTGNVLAFTMACTERGILTPQETGRALTFGNGEAMVEMIKSIAKREGFGNVLAEGVKRAAEKIGRGAERLAIHVKGLEPAAYEPRSVMGMALAYATSDRGACHLRAPAYRPAYAGAVEKYSIKGQPELVKELQDTNAVVDSMVLCRFSALPLLGPFVFWDHLARAYSLTTGMSIDERGLRLVGERIYSLTRSFNVRQGLTRRDDMLPERWFKEPLTTGVSKGRVVPEDEFNQMLDRYYDLRGWGKDGVPKPEKLRELGLEGIKQ